MKEVLVRTKPKDSFTLVVSDNSANIQTTFTPPLYFIRKKFDKATIRSNGVLMWERLGQFSTYQLDVKN